MKFSTREDIEAPIDFVFARVTDFDNFERRAMRHGAHVVRHGGGVAVGTKWDVAFTFRDRERQAEATLSTLQQPHEMQIDTIVDGLTTQTKVELVALSPGRTRVIIGLELRARTLTARLLLQSLKLAKGKLTKRFKGRVIEFVEGVEDQYRHPRA